MRTIRRPEQSSPSSLSNRAAETLESLKEVLGVPDMDSGILRRALTHRSYSFEHDNVPHNERLEFLGDSVLGLVITDALFRRHPDMSEGGLAKLRSGVVSAKALAEVARTLGLGDHILLGHGEETTGGRNKASILSDTVEAVLGAIYVECGIDTASDVIHRVFDPVIDSAVERGAGLDWKTALQEAAADHELGAPAYTIDESGPPHNKTFTASVQIDHLTYTGGVGPSKKEAQQQVARIAWKALNDSAR